LLPFLRSRGQSMVCRLHPKLVYVIERKPPPLGS
jgi:hypothetical protein